MLPAAAVLGALLLWLGFGKKRRAECIDTFGIYQPIPLSRFPRIPVPPVPDERCQLYSYDFQYYDEQCKARAFTLATWDGSKQPLSEREAIERELARMFRGGLRILRDESSQPCGGGYAGAWPIIPGPQDFGR